MKYLSKFLFVMSGTMMLGSAAQADFVINDDLIVDGSACVGFDCVNGEVFGFDTIKVKENNLRITFDDTSAAASFPDNDWQLTANDSSNGGLDKFSIDDISGSRTPFTIEAGAPSHSLYVDDGGRVGFGTSSPSTELHVVDGDTPTLRLAQDASSGFTPQTWDLAGNEANFFLRDVTNGSTLPFRVRPGAPSSAIDISANGDVGFGTASPTQRLTLVKAGAVAMDINNSSIPEFWRFRMGGSGNFVISEASVSGTDEMVLTPAGDLTILGGLVTGTAGSCTAGTPCDAVFQPDKFTVPSIEEHAEFMWENSHLKAVGPTLPNTPINLTQKTTGILHELEVAHIYIEQLNKKLSEKDTLLDDLATSLNKKLSEKDALLNDLVTRLAAVEAKM